MAIDKTDEGWSKEIRAAEIHRDKHIRVAKGLVQKMHTTCFNSEYELDQLIFEGDPVNFVYQFANTIIPQLVFTNPRARITSRRTGLMEALAAANQQCLNRWIQDVRLYRILREVVTDSLFPFGVLGIFQGDDPWPVARRISQDDFIRDPYALTKDRLRFTGHRWWKDKDAVEEAAKKENDYLASKGMKAGRWDLGVLKHIKADDHALHHLEHRGDGNMGDMPKRSEIVFYDVVEHGVVHDEYKDQPERFPSTIYTLAVTGEGQVKEVRSPRPYYGRGPSPYHIFDYGYVPNETYGLSPVVANYGQSRALNDFWRGTINAMLNYKRIVAVSAGDADFAAKIRDLGDLTVLEVSGVDRNDVIPIELGGITNQHPQTLELLQNLLDQNSGLTEAQRGVVPSEGTATASQIAATSASARVDDMEQQVYETVADALEDVVFYTWDNDQIQVPLGREAIKEMLQVPKLAARIEELQFQAMLDRAENDPGYAEVLQVAMAQGTIDALPKPEVDFIYQGGDSAFAPPGSDFEDLETQVMPYSMRRTEEGLAKRQALELLQLITQLAQLKMAAPGAIRYEELAQLMGDQMNHPGLAHLLEGEGQGGGNGAPQAVQVGGSGATGGGQLPLAGRSSGAQLGALNRG